MIRRQRVNQKFGDKEMETMNTANSFKKPESEEEKKRGGSRAMQCKRKDTTQVYC